MNVIVAGAGPGARYLMTEQLRETLKTADVVISSVHFDGIIKGHLKLGISDTIKYIEAHKNERKNVIVLASGDTGFYSIAQTISRQVPKEVNLRFLCGISSMQYFVARMGMSYADMKLVSLHGRGGSIVPHVCYNKKVFSLTGGDNKVDDILRELVAFGLGDVKVSIGERLSMRDERITRDTATNLLNRKFSSLAVMIIENKNARDPLIPLRDGDFVRGKAPMTKEAVRELSAFELGIMPGETVYDIGAGTGAMTCTLALRARENFVYAIEKDREAFEIAENNMKRLGIKNIKLVFGEAPSAEMKDFPPADKVFVGGSSGNLREIVTFVLRKNPKAEILVTAVTMETITEAFALFKSIGMEISSRLVSVSDAHRLGRYHLMRAENPVYLIKGVPKEA